nr:thioredoxin family protein [Akkermansiaceae bacterium]
MCEKAGCHDSGHAWWQRRAARLDAQAGPGGDSRGGATGRTHARGPRRRGPWEQSESVAKRLAVREGKPILIWFTDSARSPMCKALSEELFKNPEFEQWASEKIIRLRVDANVVVDDPDLSLGEKETRLVELKRYVARMKKQYKVLGQPVMVMLNPAGEVIGRYRGYKR